MSEDFRGRKKVVLKGTDDDKAYAFEFEPATSATSNDGAIPFNTNVASAVVVATDADGTDVSSSLIVGSPAVLSNIVTVALDYPSGGAGRYSLQFTLTLDDSTVHEFEFIKRIEVE